MNNYRSIEHKSRNAGLAQLRKLQNDEHCRCCPYLPCLVDHPSLHCLSVVQQIALQTSTKLAIEQYTKPLLLSISLSQVCMLQH